MQIILNFLAIISCWESFMLELIHLMSGKWSSKQGELILLLVNKPYKKPQIPFNFLSYSLIFLQIHDYYSTIYGFGDTTGIKSSDSLIYITFP